MLQFIAMTVAGLCIVLTIARPYVGLLIYIGLLYLRPTEVLPALAPYHLVRVQAIVLLLSCYILHPKRSASKSSQPVPQIKIFIGLLAFILLSTWNGWWPYTKMVLDPMVKNFIAFLLVIRLVDSESRLRGVVWTLLILSAVLAGYSSYEYFALANPGHRIGGFSGAYFKNAGDFAGMINLVVPLAIMSLWAERKASIRLVATICLALFIGAIVVSASRGSGIITLAFVLVLITISGWRSRQKNLMVGSTFLAFAIIAGVLVIGTTTFWSRASSIFDYENQITAQIRIRQIKVGLKLMMRYPLLGAGVNMIRDRAEEVYPSEKDNLKSFPIYSAHNIFIMAGAELGLGGLICLLLLLYYSIRDTWEPYRSGKKVIPMSWATLMSLGLMISVLAYMMAGMFQVLFSSTPPYLIMGLCAAMKRIPTAEEAREKGQRVARSRTYRTVAIPA